MTSILALLLAYLLGSIPFAVLVSRAMGLADPRKYGSGNPGATNVLRSGNKLAALLTLLGDAAKGAVAVGLSKQFAEQFQLSTWDLAGIAIAVFLGHVFSVFLRFKGGKGVATAAGVLFGISIELGLSVLGIWVAVAFVSRYSSLAALVAAASAPLLIAYLERDAPWILTGIVLAVILIWRHAENIRRLRTGTEGRLGRKG